MKVFIKITIHKGIFTSKTVDTIYELIENEEE